nr:DUF493 family protein [Kordia jejudonensis]
MKNQNSTAITKQSNNPTASAIYNSNFLKQNIPRIFAIQKKKEKMSSKNDPQAFYSKLKVQLDETTEFPALYMYKFIVPSDEQKIKQVHEIFDNIGAVIDTKQSSKGTYTSVTITVNMKSADAVIEKYKEASAVEGIISL